MKELFEMFNKITPQYNCECACKDSPLGCSGKTGNKKRATAFQLQNELNSDVARFTTHEKNPATLFVARQARRSVVKRATSLFSSFCRNIAKQVARFTLPVLPQLQGLSVTNFTKFLTVERGPVAMGLTVNLLKGFFLPSTVKNARQY